MVRVGLLGLGFAGQAHLAAFRQLAGVEVVAASGRASLPPGVQRCADPTEVVEHPDVDAVVVALPTYLHAEYAAAALGAGKSVLIEKPLALELDDALRLVDAAAAADGIAMAGHLLRHHPAYRATADVLRSGDLGAVRVLTTSRRSAPPTWATWFSRPERSGGALFDLLIHDLDVIAWLLGAPTSVRAVGQQSPGGTWDYVEAVLHHSDDPSRHVRAVATNLLPGNYPFTSALHVIGTTGAFELDVRHAGVQIDEPPTIRADLHLPERSVPVLSDGAVDPMAAQARAFVEAVRSGVVPDGLSMHDGAVAVAVADAVRTAVDTGDEAPVRDHSMSRTSAAPG